MQDGTIAVDTVDVLEFRSLMARFPTGVAVVTTTGADAEPLGLTCSSLCSLSVSPPMLLVCTKNDSSTLRAIRARGTFAVNLLHADGQEAAETFSSRQPGARFAAVSWHSSPRWSLPLLDEHAHAAAECRLVNTIPAADHVIVLGELLGIHTLRAGAAPLLYGMRRYVEWPS